VARIDNSSTPNVMEVSFGGRRPVAKPSGKYEDAI